MKIATGKVVGGKVVVEVARLEEGASVTVIARDGELLSIAEADRGETIPAEETLERLARRHG